MQTLHTFYIVPFMYKKKQRGFTENTGMKTQYNTSMKSSKGHRQQNTCAQGHNGADTVTCHTKLYSGRSVDTGPSPHTQANVESIMKLVNAQPVKQCEVCKDLVFNLNLCSVRAMLMGNSG